MSKPHGKRRRIARALRAMLDRREAAATCTSCGAAVPYEQVSCYGADGREWVYCLDCALREGVLRVPKR